MTCALLIMGTASNSKLSNVSAGWQAGFVEMTLDPATGLFGRSRARRARPESVRPASSLSDRAAKSGETSLIAGRRKIGKGQAEAGGVDRVGGLHAAAPGRTVPSSSIGGKRDERDDDLRHCPGIRHELRRNSVRFGSRPCSRSVARRLASSARTPAHERGRECRPWSGRRRGPGGWPRSA